MSEKDSILFVDSDKNHCVTLANIMDLKGYEADIAQTGSAALKKLKGRRFNIAVVDIKLSDMTGIELLQRMKDADADIEVIIVTGYSSTENALMALNRGAADYIKKPVDIDELAVVVSQLTAKQRLVFENRELIAELQHELAERKQAEEAIRLSEEQFRTITENSADAIFITDQQGNYQYVNNAACTMLNYTYEELIKMNIADISRQQDVEQNIKDFQKLLKTGKLYSELVLVRKNGRELPVDLNGVVLPNGMIYGSCRDITDRKKIEDRLIEVDRLKSEFIANTSHELRTPLQSIMGFTKLLLSGKVTEEERQREFLKIIEKQSEHLVVLINDLIDVQRLESGRFQVQKVEVSIQEIIADALYELNAMYVEKDIKISEHYPDGLPQVMADGLRIKQVIINLVGNAIKFSHDGGSILVKAHVDNGEMVVEVVDHGIGIPESSVGRIFERFHQVDGSLTRKEQGTGLGLYIVKQIIEAHDGRVWVESEEGKGSTFYFAIPLAPGKAQ